MTAPARARANHLHLPSVHVRSGHGVGFDYDEDIYITGRGHKARAERVVRFVLVEGGVETLIRETVDQLCFKEMTALSESLPVLMDEGNPEAQAIMEERGRREFARQIRIARGGEQACRSCGCSQTRACSGGCLWATPTLCSRCV